MTATWRAVIERAGGVSSAMLWGDALKALVDELASAEKKCAEWEQIADKATDLLRTRTSLGAKHRADLELERGAVRELSNAVEPLRKRLNAAFAVVAAARHERKVGVVGQRIEAALDAYDDAERSRP